MASDKLKLPQFALIKQYLRGQIDAGIWVVGTRTPSENELASTFSVSRMTARRALQELADEGLLLRKPGMGSFVARPKPVSPQLEITDPLQQAQATGTYSNRLIRLESMPASADIARLMEMGTGDSVYELVIVHLDGQTPVQWQQLTVNPALAPALLKQTFNKITPQAYLDWVSPSTSVEHQLEAVLPSASQRRELTLTEGPAAPCIKLTRRCWTGQQVRCYSLSMHPANIYRLGTNLN